MKAIRIHTHVKRIELNFRLGTIRLNKTDILSKSEKSGCLPKL